MTKIRMTIEFDDETTDVPGRLEIPTSSADL